MPVSKRLSQLLDNMAPPERAEVETFAAFVVARRSLRNLSVFRTHKLALLDKSLILRVLGELDRDLMNEIEERLRIALGL